MKIKYLAHAAFLITAGNGTKIITDPYETSGGLQHGDITQAADIVTVSHEHGDHNNVKAVRGNPVILKASGEARGIRFNGVKTDHDSSGGSRRGKNTVFCFEVDGVNVCHAGDLGHVLTDEQVKATGRVDVLMLPVGGNFTINAAEATRVCEQLKPAMVIPMHYKTEKLDFPISDADDFLKGKNNIQKPGVSEIEVKKDSLPETMQVMVLKPAL